MNLADIVIKIKNNYNEYLTYEDKIILDNNPSEYNIRVIVSKIWDKYLTDSSMHEDHNFRYLVKKNNIIGETTDITELPVFQDKTHLLEILSSENIIEEKSGRIGFVVTADWLDSNKILLPDDLQNGVYVKTKLIPLSLFCINIGEGIINVDYDLAKIICEENGMAFLDLNLRKYISNYKLGLGDKQEIINGFVSYYLMERNKLSNMDENMRLRAKYGSYIIKKYHELTIGNELDVDRFISEMSKFIDTYENNPSTNFKNKSK